MFLRKAFLNTDMPLREHVSKASKLIPTLPYSLPFWEKIGLPLFTGKTKVLPFRLVSFGFVGSSLICLRFGSFQTHSVSFRFVSCYSPLKEK